MRTDLIAVAFVLAVLFSLSPESATAQTLSGSVAVDGAELPYTVEGQGRPCIVFGSEAYYRRVFPSQFKSLLRCAYMDTRMFRPHASSPSDGTYDMGVAIEDIEAVRQDLNWPRIIVVGHSLQALIALEYGRAYPEHTEGVIMIGMAPRWPTGEDQEAFWNSEASDERRRIHESKAEARRRLQQDTTMSASAKFNRTYVLNGAQYWYDADFDSTPLWEGVSLNVALFNEWVAASGQDYDLTGDPPVNAPILVAVGRHDYVVPWTLWNGRAKEALSRLTFVVFERSGHTPPYEEPERFTMTVEEWLSSF